MNEHWDGAKIYPFINKHSRAGCNTPRKKEKLDYRAARGRLEQGEGGCQKGEKGPSISFSVTLAIGKNGTAFIVVQKFRERYHNAYSKNYLR